MFPMVSGVQEFEQGKAILEEVRQELARELGGGGEPRLVNLSVWPWMWAHLLLGEPAGYNAVWLLSFILAGYGMYLLTDYLLPHGSLELRIYNLRIPAAPFLAGVAYMFLPYRVAHAHGHFGAMQTGWLPLILLLAILFVRRPTPVRLAGLAALLTIQAWTEHHYLVWLLLIGFIAAWFDRAEIKIFLRDRAKLIYAGALAGLLFLLVVLPYWPTIRLAFTPNTQLALGVEQTMRFSADPFAYITPASFHPVWGGAAHFFFGRYFTGNQFEATQYLGLAPLLLTLFFWQSIPARQRFFWGTVAAVFLVLSFGPRLHLLGRVTKLTLPYALFDSWPVFSSVRAIARAGSIVGLAGIILFAWVLQRQLHRTGAAAAMLLLILAEFLFWPAPVQSAALPNVYDDIASLPGTAIVDLPAATNYAAASRALYASQVHGKDVVGNIALERAYTNEELDSARSLPGLRQLLFLRTEHLLSDRTDFFEQDMAETLPDVLHYLDVQVVVVHRDSLSPKQVSAARHVLEDVLQLSPADFGDAVRYVLPQSLAGDGVFLARDEAWTVTFDSGSATTLAQIDNAANLTLYNITAQPHRVALEFSVAAQSEGSLVVTAGKQVLFDPATAGENQVVRIQIEIPPGVTSLDFSNRLPGPVIIQNPRLLVE